MDIEELKLEMAERMQDTSSRWSKQYEQVKEDLQFASGDQWEPTVIASRGKRPSLTLNFVRTYVNRVVNPLRMNPFGINIEGTDDAAEIVKGVIREIEYASCAKEVYEVAYESAVTSGIGWIKVEHDYKSDNDIEQEIRIKAVSDPLSIWIDPDSEAIDGSDAEYAFCINYIDEKKAQRLYKTDGMSNMEFSGLDTIYKGWSVPADKIADVIYYNVEHERKKRYWYDEGVFEEKLMDEMGYEREPLNERMVDRKFVKAYHFVGSELVEKTELPISGVPVIPVYGDRMYDDNLRWSGLVAVTRDSQRMINFYASSEAELAALAPKSPWLIAEGQTEGYTEIWKRANTEAWESLVYKPTTIGEQVVPPPSRVDNQAQTGGLQASRAQAQQDMSRETGIFDNMFGAGEGMGAESGRAVLAKQSQGELATAQYLDNLTKSIRRTGQLILEMAPSIYDTERDVRVRDDEDGAESVRMNLAEILQDTKRFDISVESGPAYESRRRESLAGMMALGQAMPDKMPLMADKIAKNSDFPDAKIIAERFEKMLPPELREQDETAIPPEAQQALQTAQQTVQELQSTNDQLMGVIQQLQTAIIDNNKDRETDLEKTRIQEESDLAQTEMKVQGDLAKEQMKQMGEDDRANAKISQELRKELIAIVAEATKNVQPTIDVNEEVEMMDAQAQPDAFRVPPQAPGPVSLPEDDADMTLEDLEGFDLTETEQ